MDVRIGTCGYGRYPAPDDWNEQYESKLQAYTDTFRTVELNRTFYKLPQVSTAEKWRRRAAEPFEFAMKAWQALTHSNSSPTWNNRRDQLTDKQKEEFGDLRPTESNVDAWRKTRAIAEALEAPVVVIQCPPSFGPEDQHLQNMEKFFGAIDRGDIAIAWEPRGDWKDEPELVAEICDELDLIHVVDPLRDAPVDGGDTGYVRLHGLNDDPYDYDYDYSREELAELVDRLEAWSADRERIYCMFNNHEKFANGWALREMLE